jgi:hypothetical protein
MIPDPDFFPIPDPGFGSRGQKALDPGSGTLLRTPHGKDTALGLCTGHKKKGRPAWAAGPRGGRGRTWRPTPRWRRGCTRPPAPPPPAPQPARSAGASCARTSQGCGHTAVRIGLFIVLPSLCPLFNLLLTFKLDQNFKKYDICNAIIKTVLRKYMKKF